MKMRLFFRNELHLPQAMDNIEIANKAELDLFPAATSLTGVHFKAYDSDESEIDLSKYRDYTVKVSWYDKPVPITREGTLPNIMVHKDCTERRLLTLDWTSVKQQIEIEHSFYLTPYPDKPQRLVVDVGSHSLEFPINKIVTEALHIKLYDAYNNVIRTKDMMERLEIRPVSERLKIDEKAIKKIIPSTDANSLNSISFVITRIKLLPNDGLSINDTVYGQTRLQFTVKGHESIREFITINVMPSQIIPTPKKTPVKAPEPVPTKISIQAVGPLKRIAKTPSMPVIVARLLTQDGKIIEDYDPQKMELHLFLASDPRNFQTFRPNMNSRDTNLFRFRIDMSPDPGLYRVKVVCALRDKKIEETLPETINIVPGPAVKLIDKSVNPLNDIPIVVNVNDIEKPVIGPDLNLVLADKNDIPIDENISEHELLSGTYMGGVDLKIVRTKDHQRTSLDERIPELEGCDQYKRLKLPIVKGRVMIDKEIRIKASTAQVADQSEFFIEFRPYLNKESRIALFYIRLLFCNDTERVEELRDLQNVMSAFQTQKDETKRLYDAKKKELDKQYRLLARVDKREKEIKDQLYAWNEKTDLRNDQIIQTKIDEYQRLFVELAQTESQRRFRHMMVSRVQELDGVVGKVAHLAYIWEDSVARALSYYLQHKMDVVVTKNEKIAKKLREEYDVNQTLSLDSHAFKDYKRFSPYYHNVNQELYLTSGVNYAIMKFEMDETLGVTPHDLKKVFHLLLGDTLYAESLEKAETFRNESDRCGQTVICPTIVSKDGIIFSNGIIDVNVPQEDGRCGAFQVWILILLMFSVGKLNSLLGKW